MAGSSAKVVKQTELTTVYNIYVKYDIFVLDDSNQPKVRL